MLALLDFRARLLAGLYHGFLTRMVLVPSCFSFDCGACFSIDAEVALLFLGGRISPGSMGLAETSWSWPVPLKHAAHGQIGTVG